MRRIILVLAVGLILLVCLGGDAFSRVQPYNHRSPFIIVSEDHPWGGEHEGGDPGFESANQDDSRFVVTGFTHLDVFLNSVFVKWWLGNDIRTGEATQPTHHAVPMHHHSDDLKLEANSSDKGN